MNLGALTGSGETAPVTGFAIDHRTVAPGTVFGAFRGGIRGIARILRCAPWGRGGLDLYEKQR